MKDSFMKNLISKQFRLALLGIGLLTVQNTLPEAPPKMPSVADVFGNLSEQEIAEQVKIGQQFLEDLDKNGTPEEKAEFERLLVETLNSMSEADFQDIQAIAQMVEPHLQTPETQPTTAQETPKSTETPSFQTGDVEEFKKLITTIIQRIDDIFQKIKSSKECSEEVNTRWKSKTTFNNMKRQIYQLNTDRLAKKLATKDFAGEDKDLVEGLKKFLKELSKENDSLTIEDDFGLPSSLENEKKHLKQTKSILSMLDDYIDSLMPKLEKFLRKWDPEALEMAKEAEEKTKVAIKQATEATVRRPSPDASAYTAPVANPYRSASSTAGYADYGQYPDYDQGYYPGNYGAGQQGSAPATSGAGASATKGKTDTAPTTQAAKAKDKEEATKKESNSRYNYLSSELEGHFDDYPIQHEDKFVDFFKKEIVDRYPDIVKEVDVQGGTLNPVDENNWVFSRSPGEWAKINFNERGFANYAKRIHEKLTKDFYNEFTELDDTLSKTKQEIFNLSADELKKLQNSTELANLERRLKRYQQVYKTSLEELKKKYEKNLSSPISGNTSLGGIQNDSAQKNYTKAHDDFIYELRSRIEDKIEPLLAKVTTIKRNAKRNAQQKQSQKASATK